MTSIIPTDKSGRVYYGPRTLAQAFETISDIAAMEQASGMPIEEQRAHCDIAVGVAGSMQAAGYSGVAARLRKHYGI